MKIGNYNLTVKQNMDIEHDYNFNDPVEVVKIFRYRKNEEEAMQEFGSRCTFCWEDVSGVEEYPFIDDWKKYTGSKYYIRLRSIAEPLLVFGDYDSVSKYWLMFRNKYPLYNGTD